MTWADSLEHGILFRNWPSDSYDFSFAQIIKRAGDYQEIPGFQFSLIAWRSNPSLAQKFSCQGDGIDR